MTIILAGLKFVRCGHTHGSKLTENVVHPNLDTGWGTKNCTCDCCLLYKLSAIFGSPPCRTKTMHYNINCSKIEFPFLFSAIYKVMLKDFMQFLGAFIKKRTCKETL